MSDLIPRLDAAIDHDACPSLLRDVRAELLRLTQEHAGLCNSVDRLMAANERLRGLLRDADIELEEQVDDDHRDWHARQAREDALAGAAVRETPQVTIDSANECPDCHGIPIKTGGPIVHAANCRIEPLFPGAADQPDDALSKLADDLEEASTVLDEQFHRDAICNVMLRAARALRQATPQPEAALPQYCRQLSNYPPTDMMPCDCGETCAVAARGGTADQQPAPQPEVATCDACDRVRHQWQRECADTDSLLQTLGLCPSEYRSDGGSLLLGRISHKLASIAAAKPEAK